MRRIAIFISALMVCIGVAAQTKRLGDAQGSVNEKSLNILNNVSKIYKSSTGIQLSLEIGFTDNKTGQTAGADGTLKTAGKKFALKTTFAEIYFDGQTLNVYDKQNNELTISSPTAEEISDIDPTAIISMFKQGYKISEPEVSKTDSNITLIRLYPEDRKADYSMITVTINTATSTPVEIITCGKNGVDNVVKIKKVESGKQFDDSIFQFDANKHKGIIITDLR